MGSANFRAYVANINRVHLIELIDKHHRARNVPPFRASLIANPLTGRPYGGHQDAPPAQS